MTSNLSSPDFSPELQSFPLESFAGTSNLNGKQLRFFTSFPNDHSPNAECIMYNLSEIIYCSSQKHGHCAWSPPSPSQAIPQIKSPQRLPFRLLLNSSTSPQGCYCEAAQENFTLQQLLISLSASSLSFPELIFLILNRESTLQKSYLVRSLKSFSDIYLDQCLNSRIQLTSLYSCCLFY